MPGLSQVLPIAQWLPHYTGGELRGDLVAGVTVGVMLIPQSMAYALLAGMPPIYGLYASVVPLLVYPIFGTSRHLAIGITAIDMLLVAAGVGLLAEAGTATYVGLAFLLAMMVGVVQIIMGVARLGFMVNLLSRPVIQGFTAGAVVTIAFSQLRNLLAIPIPSTSDVSVIIQHAASSIGQTHLLSFGIGAAGIVLLALLKRQFPIAPGPLIAVLLGTLAVWYFGLDGKGVAIVGEIPKGLPHFELPGISLDAVRTLMPTVITLALVQFMSVISLGKVFAARHRYTVGPNRELVALGALNVAGSLFRSMPVSGSFSRSAVSEQAGGKTAMVNIVAAAMIGLTLLFLTPLFYYLPIPVFASIIIVAAVGLLDVKELRFLWRTKRIDGFLALLTFFATLALGIQHGVLLGISASVVAIMYRISRPNAAVLGHLPDTRSFRDIRRHPEADTYEGVLILRVDASFSFANAEFLRDLILQRTRDDVSLHSVIIDASSINDLDTTAASLLDAVGDILHDRGIELYLAGVKGPVLDVARESGLLSALGEDHFHLSPHRALSQALSKHGRLEDYLRDVPGGQAAASSKEHGEDREAGTD
jgi:SulP family sulfate permease